MAEEKEKFSFKKFLYPLFSAIVLALALYFAAWIANYANTQLHLESSYWQNFVWFIENYLWVFFSFALVIGYWQYFYFLYREKLRYLKPLIHTIELMFGAWLIVELLSGLMILFGENAILGFFKEFYYSQFWLLAIFVAAIAYAKFFLQK